jgi:hypothetical protein
MSSKHEPVLEGRVEGESCYRNASPDLGEVLGAGRTRSSPPTRAELSTELDGLIADYARFPTSRRQVRIKTLRDRIDRIDARSRHD